MMKHVWSILCERIITDRETNLVSYLTAIEVLMVQKVPIRIPFLALGSLWRSDNEQETGVLELRLKLEKPDKSQEIIIPSYKAQFTTKRYRANMVLNGWEFNQFGTYRFQLECCNNEQWELASELLLDVIVVAQAQETKKIDE